MLTALLLLCGFVAASPFPPGFTIFNVSITGLTVPANTSNLYLSLFSPASNGALFGDGREISTVVTFFPAVVYYEADHPYDFSLTTGADCGSVFFDTAVFTVGMEFINGTLINTQHPVTICGTDVQNLPIGESLDILVQNATTTFNFTLQDFDDRRGLTDGLWSLYSLHESDGSFSPNAGVRFLGPNTNEVILCDTEAPAVVNFTYPRSEFCFAWSGFNGTRVLDFLAIDTAGGESSVFSLTVSSAKLDVCRDCVLNTTQQTAIQVDLPYELFSRYQTPVVLFLATLPLNGQLTNADGRVLTVGTRVPAGTPIFYTGFVGYFNQYQFPDGSTSTDTDTGAPIVACGEVRCPDFFGYRAETTVQGTLFRSPVGAMGFMVNRIITEQMGVCDSALYQDWEYQPCASLGMAGVTVGVFIAGSDGRITPSYNMVIDSLPVYGTLYHANGTGVNLEFGPPAVVGDIIGTPYTADPNMLYVPYDGYSNRYLFDTSPVGTLSMVDDLGAVLPPCPQSNSGADPRGPTCTDGFQFHTVSSFDPQDVSPPGNYMLQVARETFGNLTACWINGTSHWGTPCVSYGFETNRVYNDYAIAVYLTVDFETEDYTFQILSLPERGILYYNNGTDEDPVYGFTVPLGAVITPMANTSWPQLLYVGLNDYFNMYSPAASSTEYFANAKGVPFGTCPNGNETGCFDHFTYQVITATRISNVGNYSLRVSSLVSNSTFEAPAFFVFQPYQPYFFGANTPITYIDPDDDVYYVQLQLTFDFGVLGANISLDGMAFDGEAVHCFNSTGCIGSIKLHALPSDMQRIFDALYFTLNQSITSEDNFLIYMSMSKRLPEGFTNFNMFDFNPGDIILVADMQFYSIFDGGPIDYYEYDPYANGTLAPVPPFVIPDDYGCEVPADQCTQFYQQVNDDFMYTQWIIAVSVSCGLAGALLLVLIIMMLWQRSMDAAATKPSTKAQSYAKKKVVPKASDMT